MLNLEQQPSWSRKEGKMHETDLSMRMVTQFLQSMMGSQTFSNDVIVDVYDVIDGIGMTLLPVFSQTFGHPFLWYLNLSWNALIDYFDG